MDYIVRHFRVDLACQFNELGGKIILPCFGGKIEWINGNAVSAKPRAGVKWHETEWLGTRGPDYLPYINLHAMAEHFKFIYHGDIDRAENVFQEFRHLSSLG